jgi:pimeloyl-ACP methyl ester carboxylesterase
VKKLGLILALTLVLAACKGNTSQGGQATLPPPQVVVETVTPRPSGAAAATATLPPGAPTPAAPQPLSIAAPDGLSLAATFYPPALSSGSPAGAKAPGVLLLPMYGSTKSDWDVFARELQKRGIAALALDLRGQGQSAGPEDWAKAPADVTAAWQALIARPEVDPKHSAIVGASIGANLALVVGAGTPEVAAVIALSPGLDFKGVKPVGTLGNFGDRGVLFIASQDDQYSYDSVRQMASLAPKGETNYFATAGHGTDMFSAPTLTPMLLSWLEDHLGVMKG